MQQFFENVHMPILALRGVNVFPETLMTFDVERSMSHAAMGDALRHNSLIFLSAQKDFNVEEPDGNDIYRVGTICRIRQQIRQPKGNLCRVMVEGLSRAELIDWEKQKSGELTGFVTSLPDKTERVSSEKMEALLRNCVTLFEDYLQEVPDAVNDQILNVLANPEPGFVTNYISQNLRIDVELRQKVLEELRPSKRLELLAKLLVRELHVLEYEKQISSRTQEAMNKEQREYYLREEMKAIRAELGEDDDTDDVEYYRTKINESAIPQESKEKLQKEVKRLSKQPFGSSEAAVIRTYLDTCLELPWGIRTEETIDLAKAERILDEDHFGLQEVKDRILEFLAVRKLSPDIRGGLICLVGPPGTGKTSIAMSVARAVNRKLVRVSLGGVHDEAEIRGHRKTYVGAMPGRIINGIVQAGSCNPLMVLDEIDKLGSDYKGDPSAALLEVLDGEQNGTFRDHFLEIPFDLSEVFFIATANNMDTIPRPLLDRMEVISLSSYTDEEKLQITKQHLLTKQKKKHGLKPTQVKINDAAIRGIITGYTRESGVRGLEREIAAVCRKAATGIAREDFKALNVTPAKLESLLGPAKFKPDEKRKAPEVGVVRGLAYTSVGGEVLDVEVAVVDGTGKLEVTGNLGDVMKESVRYAMTYIRSRAEQFGLKKDFYSTKDIHIHFPEAAVPKDGPSAGITITMALISALTGIPVRQDVCMTGEINLRGNIMAIGGLREKTMAALRTGMKDVIIPRENEPDLAKIDQTVRGGLHFVPVGHLDEALDTVFVRNPLNCTVMQMPYSEATEAITTSIQTNGNNFAENRA